MAKRLNVLWMMSDQHNANSTGYSGDPNVKTPNLDRLAAGSVNFRRAYTVNPICAPSRLSFITGQYCHTHGLFGNMNNCYDKPNPDTLACLFRRNGYQTAIFGKAHMVRLWDEEGFEHIRYDNLGDIAPDHAMGCDYFKQVMESGKVDQIERERTTPTEGGTRASAMPYEMSVEHFTGEETVRFLKSRDRERPFFAQMSFQRPHGAGYAAKEYFEMYDPDKIVLPASAADLYENRFASKPEKIRNAVLAGSGYPLATQHQRRLKEALCGYYGLISMIDNEIGRVIDALRECGDLENTVIIYTADHGDFAGEHGLFLKGLDLYESLHRIPFLLVWPGGPKGQTCDEIVETIDLYPTVCNLCGIEIPPGRDGRDMVPVALGRTPGKDAAFCEFLLTRKTVAMRTKEYRLIFDTDASFRELYDEQADPGELHNLWDNPKYAEVKVKLLDRLLDFTMDYRVESSYETDAAIMPTLQASEAGAMHFGGKPWTEYQGG